MDDACQRVIDREVRHKVLGLDEGFLGLQIESVAGQKLDLVVDLERLENFVGKVIIVELRVDVQLGEIDLALSALLQKSREVRLDKLANERDVISNRIDRADLD